MDNAEIQAFLLGKLDEDESNQVVALMEQSPEFLAQVRELERAVFKDPFLHDLEHAAQAERSTSAELQRAIPTHPEKEQSSSQGHASANSKADVGDEETAAFPPKKLSGLHPDLATLEDFEIVSKLGSGGMGVVYAAKNLQMGGRMEALKVLNHELLQDIAAVDRFEREIQVSARLSGHENIVTAHQVLRTKSLIVLVMEHVKGMDLHRYVTKRGPLNPSQACNLVRQVSAGLRHAQKQNMVHRDIKPANIMATREGVAKILDFGLGKAQHEGLTKSLTKSGVSMGTPHFMAPEQLSDPASVDTRADIYSLGSTMYFLLSGRPAFTGSLHQIYAALSSHQTLPDIREIRSDVSDELAAIITRMTAADRDERFQNPGEVLKAFVDLKKKTGTRQVVRNELDSPHQHQSPQTNTPAEASLVQPMPTPTLNELPPALNQSSPLANKMAEAANLVPEAPPSSPHAATGLEAVVFESHPNSPSSGTLYPGSSLPPAAETNSNAGPTLASSAYPTRPPGARKSSNTGLIVFLFVAAGLLGLAAAGLFWGLQQSPTDDQLELEYASYKENVEAGLGSVEFLKKHADERFTEWNRLAEKGNPIAQLFIGRCYQEGLVVEEDYKTANRWLMRSAEKKNSYAMLTLGLAYSDGQGVMEDPAEVLKWYTMAAEQGNSVAMRNLGFCYVDGTLAEDDTEKALSWFRKSAEAGDTSAMRLVGNYYRNGWGVEQDLEQARIWNQRAIDNGDSQAIGIDAGERLGSLYKEWLEDQDQETSQSLKNLSAEILGFDLIGIKSCVAEALLDWSKIEQFPEEDLGRQSMEAIRDKYFQEFANAANSQKLMILQSFCNTATHHREKLQRDGKNRELVEFWEEHIGDSLSPRLSQESSLIDYVNFATAVVKARLRLGDRERAIQLLNATSKYSDQRLAYAPWDWWIKFNHIQSSFNAAQELRAVGEKELANQQLRIAWDRSARMFGESKISGQYDNLPLRGEVPSDASESDRKLFERFSSDIEDNKIKSINVPAKFGDITAPYTMFLVPGPRGYAELQDQIKWLKEVRGGELDQKVLDSFQRLNDIAIENNVDFAALTHYALNEAEAEDTYNK